MTENSSIYPLKTAISMAKNSHFHGKNTHFYGKNNPKTAIFSLKTPIFSLKTPQTRTPLAVLPPATATATLRPKRDDSRKSSCERWGLPVFKGDFNRKIAKNGAKMSKKWSKIEQKWIKMEQNERN
jgi:hypothetical protein